MSWEPPMDNAPDEMDLLAANERIAALEQQVAERAAEIERLEQANTVMLTALREIAKGKCAWCDRAERARAALDTVKETPQVCEWRDHSGEGWGYYKSSCGKQWGWYDKQHRFCPHCGRPITVKEMTDG